MNMRTQNFTSKSTIFADMNNTYLYIILSTSLAVNVVMTILFLHNRWAYHKLIKKSLSDQSKKDQIIDSISFELPDIMDEHDKDIIMSLKKAMETDKIYLNPMLGIQDLAKIIGTNKNKLSSIINSYLHISYTAMLNQYRIRESINILSDPKYFSYKIETIGEMCGYSNRQVFHAAFKKEMGITPTHFRNINKANKNKQLNNKKIG